MGGTGLGLNDLVEMNYSNQLHKQMGGVSRANSSRLGLFHTG